MRMFLTVTTLFSFLVIALFGFAAMNHSGGDHADCLAAQVQTANCSARTGVWGMIAAHFNVFNLFSKAVFSQNILSIISVFLFLFFSVGFLSAFKIYFADLKPAWPLIGNRFDPFAFKYSSSEKITRWLALFENSPALIMGR